MSNTPDTPKPNYKNFKPTDQLIFDNPTPEELKKREANAKRRAKSRATPEKRKEQVKKIANKIIDDIDRPLTGSGGKANFPNAQLKTLEDDDSKRDVIAKVLNNCITFYQMGFKPVENDEELCERLVDFFNKCAETRQLVTVEKMCLAIGYPVQTVVTWDNGTNQGFSPITSLIIKKAKNIIASQDAELVADGKINNIAYIFRAKNYYGMSDKQELEVTDNRDLLGDKRSVAEIEKRLKGATIIEID